MHFLGPDALRGIALEELLGRTDLVVAFGDGDVRGVAAAALLFADYAVLHERATLTIDTPEGWSAVVWRLGRKALRWQLDGMQASEVVDEIAVVDAAQWREEWMRHRSVMALDAAAALIRARGGDALERAAFARLFAIGEPQKGLAAFLAKRRPSW